MAKLKKMVNFESCDHGLKWVVDSFICSLCMRWKKEEQNKKAKAEKRIDLEFTYILNYIHEREIEAEMVCLRSREPSF